MGYHPNTLARQLAMNRSMRIGYVVPHRSTRKGPLQVSYFSTILDAMVSEAYKLDYDVSIINYDEESSEMVANLADRVRSRNVDGLVLVGLRQDSSLIGELAKTAVPFALLDSQYDMEKISQVVCDPAPAHIEMLANLAANGYRRLYFVTGDMGYHHAIAQRRSLLDVLARTKTRIVLADELKGNYTRRSGYLAAERICEKSKPGDCVFLSNDRMAMGFYRYCYEKGVRIPTDIGVIGSDNDEAATALYPDLTTIYQPRLEMGEEAVKIVVSLLNGEPNRTVVLPKRFIMGKSIRKLEG
jgi:DNA-binding LacI/PurR family transcriptional regulator